PVVLNFWASWCIPCAHEAPRLVASAKEHEGRVLFLGVDVKDFSSDARKFLRRFHVNYVSVRDGGSDTYDAYGLTGLPESYFLDTDCKTKCPVFASDIGAGLRLLSGSEHRQVVALALTVNPARDTPASVRAFLRRRHALEIDFLLGTAKQMRPIWKEFHVVSAA